MFEGKQRNRWTARFAVVALLGGMPVLAADYTTVDIGSYVNSNIYLNPQTMPVGTTTGNQNTNIPFDVATYNGMAGTWNARYDPAATVDVKVQVSGQASFYALLNNYFGTPGADEYDVTIKATNGDSITYQSIGGVNTRDYNAAVYTNSISNSTFEWFNNGVGQRMDLREFNLPASFANDTISDFIITQDVPKDSALFSGLTFSDAPAYSSAPEPVSAGLLVLGLSGCALFRRFRKA